MLNLIRFITTILCISATLVWSAIGNDYLTLFDVHKLTVATHNQIIVHRPKVLLKGIITSANAIKINNIAYPVNKQNRFYTKHHLELRDNWFLFELFNNNELVSSYNLNVYFDPSKIYNARRTYPLINVSIDNYSPDQYLINISGKAYGYHKVKMDKKEYRIKSDGSFFIQKEIKNKKHTIVKLLITSRDGHSVHYNQEIQLTKKKGNKPKYKLQPGDMIDIIVKDLAFATEYKVLVAPDGKIYPSFLKSIQAEGRTIDEVKEELRMRLKQYILDPNVSILLQAQRGSNYVILGMVNDPGRYELNRSLTLTQAVYRAQGFQRGLRHNKPAFLMSYEDSYIIRNNQKLNVDFKAIFEDFDLTQDVPIQQGDFIYIGSNLSLQSDIYIVGKGTPGRVLRYYPNTTLGTILSEIGVRDIERLDSVVLLRKNPDGEDFVYKANPKKLLKGKTDDIALEPGDIIYVSDDKLTYIRNLKDTIITAYMQTIINGAFSDRTFFYE